MTFSIVARQDGRFGMAVCSSSPAVAARCVHLRPGVGAAASQNVTDPRLGPRLLDRLGVHGDSARALAEVVGGAPDVAYRQLAVIGRRGPAAWYSGEKALGVHAGATGTDAVTAGNLLSGRHLPQAMLDGFETADGELEARLLAALRAALAAGGEEGPVHSAGLAVVGDVEWRITDLRVDWDDAPVQALSRLLDLWLPQRDDYVTRASNPAHAPSYGVPGNPI